MSSPDGNITAWGMYRPGQGVYMDGRPWLRDWKSEPVGYKHSIPWKECTEGERKMEWYEHLLGILAVFTCINWIIIMAAVRVGARADEHCKKAFANSMPEEKRSVAAIPRSLDRIADLPFLRRGYHQTPRAEPDTTVLPVIQSTEVLTSSQN